MLLQHGADAGQADRDVVALVAADLCPVGFALALNQIGPFGRIPMGVNVDGAQARGLRVLSLGVHRAGQQRCGDAGQEFASRRHGLPSLLSPGTAEL